MGQQAPCKARFGGKTSEGEALLESEELRFRGGFELRIPLRSVRAVEARAGRLTLATPDGTASFELGALAEAWALKIRHPRSLADKLGIKPGSRVVVLGIDDAAFREQLEARTADVSWGRLRKDADLVFVAMESAGDLPRLARLREAIRPDGAVWVVWPKGRKAFREDDVRAFGPQAGLVDVKVVAFSAALSALKMVIPVAARPRAGRPRG